MGKKLTRQDIINRVNGARSAGKPYTMRNWQRALSVARQKKLAPVKTLDRLAKSR